MLCATPSEKKTEPAKPRLRNEDEGETSMGKKSKYSSWRTWERGKCGEILRKIIRGKVRKRRETGEKRWGVGGNSKPP